MAPRTSRSLSKASNFMTLMACQVALCLGSTQVCNNSPQLCDRSYANITQLGAHDSPFVRDAANGYSISGDQYYNSTTQLAAGVRMLTAQVYSVNSTLRLCHTDCGLLDAGPLVDWLSSIGGWLDQNPNDVVSLLLVNSDGVNAADLASQYDAAGVTRYAFRPSFDAATRQWPTLRELIQSGTRLISFIASLEDNSAAPFLLNEFTYLFENNYDNTQASDFSCVPNRPPTLAGDLSGALSQGFLPVMNHFLYQSIGAGIEFPDVVNITNTNAPDGQPGNLGHAAAACSAEYGYAPTFVLVDFFNVGPAIDTIDRLNGVSDNVEGRLLLESTGRPSSTPNSASSTSLSAVSTAATSSSSSSASITTTTSYGATSSTQASSSQRTGSGAMPLRSPAFVGSFSVLLGIEALTLIFWD